MESKHLGVIHLVDMIAGKDQKVLRRKAVNKVDILRYRIGCAAVYIQIGIGFFSGRQNIYSAVFGVKPPASSRCYITVEHDRLILGQHAHYIHSAVGAVAQWKIHDPVFSPIGYGRLCDLFCQFMETASATACQNHRQHTVLTHKEPSLSIQFSIKQSSPHGTELL